MDALQLAMEFHEIYERLAPQYGYTTRTDTKVFDPNTPNGKLMVAVCGEILTLLDFPDGVCAHNVSLAEECQMCHRESQQCT